jgi:chromosome segregation ATPase
MSTETGGPGGEGLDAQVREAERRLQEAARIASEAEHRALAEIKALEADLERQRADAEQALEKLKLQHEEELQGEREAKRQAIATAEERLGEIEAQAETAEERIAAAERRAAEVEQTVEDEKARARESAAAWLREQLDSLRREAGGR